MLLAFRTTKFQTKNKYQMKDKTSNETETANSIKPAVIKSVLPIDWDKLEKDFNEECLHPKREGYGERMDDFKLHPTNLFLWFKEKIIGKTVL